MLPPDKRADELIERLKRKIEVFVVAVCIIIIVICCVYGYIVHPMKDGQVKSSITIGYEKFKSFSMPIGDIKGTEEYDDETVATYTDDWGIRYEVKERTK
jgi:hypothetical protein